MAFIIVFGLHINIKLLKKIKALRTKCFINENQKYVSVKIIHLNIIEKKIPKKVVLPA